MTAEINGLDTVTSGTGLYPAAEDSVAGRFGHLPRDVGWMLFGVGFAGFVAPGIIGLPFMVAGGLILWPKTTHRMQGMLGNGASNKALEAGMKQVTRFLDDLEKRYPTGQR